MNILSEEPMSLDDHPVSTATITATTTTADNTTDNTTSCSTIDASEKDTNSQLLLLSTVQSLVKLEQSLTTSLSRIQPLLDNLATPQTMSQVHTILSMARSYSTQTSAPPGWNPNLPVLHFSTPNPLPHQLRQGAMGAMELQMAREEKNRKKRKVQEDRMQQKAIQESQLRDSEELQKDRAKDPKKREVMDRVQLDIEEAERRKSQRRSMLQAETKAAAAAVAATSMNLSDSSSSEEEDDEDDDDDV